MLGFYTYLSNITGWLRMQPDFPFKTYLLQLDSQTLQLVIFTILLFIILAKVKQNHDFVILQYVLCFCCSKVYIAAIVWYCYGYITALNMARSLGIITAHSDVPRPILGEVKLSFEKGLF